MKYKLALLIAAGALVISACDKATTSSGLAAGTVITNNTNPAIPALTSENSTIDCSGWTTGAKTFIRGQGTLLVDGMMYGIATFACGAPDSEFGAEFVESFVYAKGTWAANGLVTGPDTQFITTSACVSAEEITCPAAKINIKGEQIGTGTVVIYQKDGDLAWRFDSN